MILNRFDFDSLMPTPWKNGGGITREIVSLGTPFDWRVSIAQVDSDGPFSVFPGIDRTIVLLEGPGLQLQSSDASLVHTLDQALQPFDFSGDLQLGSAQLGGPSYDLNVMTRRSLGRSMVTVHRTACQLSSVARGLIYIASGQWSVQPIAQSHDHVPHQEQPPALSMNAQEGLWWESGPLTLLLSPLCETSEETAPALISVSWRAK